MRRLVCRGGRIKSQRQNELQVDFAARRPRERRLPGRRRLPRRARRGRRPVEARERRRGRVPRDRARRARRARDGRGPVPAALARLCSVGMPASRPAVLARLCSVAVPASSSLEARSKDDGVLFRSAAVLALPDRAVQRHLLGVVERRPPRGARRRAQRQETRDEADVDPADERQQIHDDIKSEVPAGDRARRDEGSSSIILAALDCWLFQRGTSGRREGRAGVAKDEFRSALGTGCGRRRASRATRTTRAGP